MDYIIVTNTINRSSELVARSISASLNQSIKPIQVILIDQNEIPLQLPEFIINNPLFGRSCVKQKGVSAARNTLIIPDGAEWIFFCDDDGYPDLNYSFILKNLITAHEELEILAGSIIREDNNDYYTLRHKKGGSLKYFRNSKNLMGSNFVVKASLFNELGRFDEKFGAGSYWGSSEETDFCWKAYFAGKKMEYFPELKVYHLPPFNESVKQGFQKAYRYGVGKGALVYKWLFYKRKFKVLYELVEMLIIPFIQIIRGLITLRPAIAVNNIAVIYGRFAGLLKAFWLDLASIFHSFKKPQ